MRLGTQDKDFFPDKFSDKLMAVKEMGFESFEVDGKVLVENLDEIKAATALSGVPVCSACGGYRGWIGDFIEERRLGAVSDLKQIIQALKEVGGKGVVVPAAWGMFTFRLPPMIAPRSREGDVQALLSSLDELNTAAEEYGINIYLEPLNRYQDHMLNTLNDAVEIIKKGGFTMVKVTADFYHMAIEEDDISKSLQEFQQYIGHIHIAENHRYQPGTGSIDFRRHMETLRAIGYTGDVVNEGRIRGNNPAEEYRKSVVYMKQFM